MVIGGIVGMIIGGVKGMKASTLPPKTKPSALAF